jgi:nucleoside-diphosphate-sugar epimerase
VHKILITGGAGYLGSVLTSQLLANNYEVTVIDKCVYGVKHLAQFFGKNYRLVVGDIREEEKVDFYAKECDAIIHLASLVGTPVCDRYPFESISVNIDGTKIICGFAAKHKKKLLFASTGTAYGKVNSLCDELQAISSETSYGRQKGIGERLALDVGGICMRFSTVYGLSQRNRDDLLIHSICRKAITDKSVVLYEPNALRSFIHVQDAAAAVIHLLAVGGQGEAYNIADPGLSLTKIEICSKIKSLVGSFEISVKDYFKDPDLRDYKVSCEKLMLTGFQPSQSIDFEIYNLINYYSSIFQSSLSNG